MPAANDANILKTTVRTAETLKGEGFPEKLTKAFLETADAVKSVVMTRVPGGATTNLIDERHDLKGFYIKAKSCDWGPMSGFLCRNPAFNKKGVENINHNWKYNNAYLKTLKEFWKKPNFNPFRPIAISDTQKKIVQDSLPEAWCHEEAVGGVTCLLGVAASSDKKKSVIVEFKLIKNGALWMLYHGNVFVKIPADETLEKAVLGDAGTDYKRYKPSDYDFGPQEAKRAEPGQMITKADRQQLNGFLKEACPALVLPRQDDLEFFAIEGIQNPFPPHDPKEYDQQDPNKADARNFASKNLHKNCVSGDYDLFAVWPIIPAIGFDDCRRISELETGYAEFGDATHDRWAKNAAWQSDVETADRNKQLRARPPQHLFMPTVAKRFALEFTRNRGTYLEFIPGFGTIDPLESLYAGNINEAVSMVVGTLNNYVSSVYETGSRRENPNVAFHSDEGGRPGVTDIDMPFAVFLPKSLALGSAAATAAAGSNAQPGRAAAPGNRILLIKTHLDFLSLINHLLGKVFVLLNYGWMIDLVHATSDPKVDEEARKQIKDALRLLVLGRTTLSRRADHPIRKEDEKAFEATIAVFEEFKVSDFQKGLNKKLKNMGEPSIAVAMAESAERQEKVAQIVSNIPAQAPAPAGS